MHYTKIPKKAFLVGGNYFATFVLNSGNVKVLRQEFNCELTWSVTVPRTSNTEQ